MTKQRRMQHIVRRAALSIFVPTMLLGCGGNGGGNNGNNDNENNNINININSNIVCQEGEFLGCEDTDLIVCGIGGDTTLRVECGPAGCNEDYERCNDCDPTEAIGCQGNRAVFCNEDGTEADGEYCDWGCQTDGTDAWCNDCTPDEASCQGDDLVTCDGAGIIATTEICESGCNSERGECNDCLPLEVHCIDDQLVACDPEGQIEQLEDCAHGCDETSLTCMCAGNECLDINTLQVCDATGLVSGTELCLNGCNSDAADAWCNDCIPDSAYCEGDVLRTCDSEGHVSGAVNCALGCNAWVTEPRCYTFDPMFVPESFMHLGVVDWQPSQDVLINTTTGAVSEGFNIVLIAAAQFYTPVNGPELFVIPVRSATFGVNVRVTGDKPLAIVSQGVILVVGMIDASAHGNWPGPGGSQDSSSPANGIDSAYDSGCGGGRFSGSGGAGHADVGGRGGNLFSSHPGGAGGQVSGSIDFDPITGGFSGGHPGTYTSTAGAGGGVVILTSLTRVQITYFASTFPTQIDVSGGAGQARGAGGGSGGSILLEAPRVIFDGVIRAIGGGGACGGLSGTQGEDGRDGGNACDIVAGEFTGEGGWGGLHWIELFGWFSPDTYGWVGGSTNCTSAFSPGGGGGAAGRFKIRAGPTAGSLSIGSNGEALAALCSGSIIGCTEFFTPY